MNYLHRLLYNDAGSFTIRETRSANHTMRAYRWSWIKALAEKAGLSVTHMSNIETGNSKLSLPMAVSLANALDVSVDEFLCDSVIRSKDVFSHEVQELLDDCDDYEIRILTDLLRAAKTTIRRDMKLKQQE